MLVSSTACWMLPRNICLFNSTSINTKQENKVKRWNKIGINSKKQIWKLKKQIRIRHSKEYDVYGIVEDLFLLLITAKFVIDIHSIQVFWIAYRESISIFSFFTMLVVVLLSHVLRSHTMAAINSLLSLKVWVG